MYILRKIRDFLFFCRDFVFCYLKIGFYDRTWRFWGVPDLSVKKGSVVSIGSGFVACSESKRNEIGVNQKVVVRTTTESAVLKIGKNVGISGSSICCANRIEIGDDVMIGSGVLIMDNDAHAVNPEFRHLKECVSSAPVFIGDKVFIGARAIVLKGVAIGRGSVVGAGSVVTKNVPEMTVVAGNPARVISKIT